MYALHGQSHVCLMHCIWLATPTYIRCYARIVSSLLCFLDILVSTMTMDTLQLAERTTQKSCLQRHLSCGQLILCVGGNLHTPADQIRDRGAQDWGRRLNQVYEDFAGVHSHLLILRSQAGLRHLQCTQEP